MDLLFAILVGILLLFISTLELWFAPNNGRLFKGFRTKLMIIVPLYVTSFGIYYFFFIKMI